MFGTESDEVAGSYDGQGVAGPTVLPAWELERGADRHCRSCRQRAGGVAPMARTADKDNLLYRGFRAARPAFLATIFFSFFINMLAFVGPIYMLQIYDRVITSRNETTLVALTLIAGFLLVVYAVLEKIRSAVLVRAGLLFDAKTRAELFEVVLRGSLKQPDKAHYSVLRELDVIREFLTGAGLIAFCDAPWVPIFIAGCFILHPWFGWVATAGAILMFACAVATELLTRNKLADAGKNAGKAHVFAAATFRNVEVLQAMGMWRALRDRWLALQNKVLGLQAGASDTAGALVSVTKFLRAFLQIAILGTGAYLAIINEATAGAMIAASIIMGRALAPVEVIVGQWKTFLAARSARARITELISVLPAQHDRMKLPPPAGHVALQGVTVVPPGGHTVRCCVAYRSRSPPARDWASSAPAPQASRAWRAPWWGSGRW